MNQTNTGTSCALELAKLIRNNNKDTQNKNKNKNKNQNQNQNRVLLLDARGLVDGATGRNGGHQYVELPHDKESDLFCKIERHDAVEIARLISELNNDTRNNCDINCNNNNNIANNITNAPPHMYMDTDTIQHHVTGGINLTGNTIESKSFEDHAFQNIQYTKTTSVNNNNNHVNTNSDNNNNNGNYNTSEAKPCLRFLNKQDLIAHTSNNNNNNATNNNNTGNNNNSNNSNSNNNNNSSNINNNNNNSNINNNNNNSNINNNNNTTTTNKNENTILKMKRDKFIGGIENPIAAQFNPGQLVIKMINKIQNEYKDIVDIVTHTKVVKVKEGNGSNYESIDINNNTTGRSLKCVPVNGTASPRSFGPSMQIDKYCSRDSNMILHMTSDKVLAHSSRGSGKFRLTSFV